MYTDGRPVSTPVELAQSMRSQLHTFVAPLLRELDFRMDARLVRTFASALESILVFRNRAMGLLLSELGGYLLNPEHAPAGTKRLSNLLRSPKWSDKTVGRYVWEQADRRLKDLERSDESGRSGEEALLLWDQSVLEKPESIKTEGLCAVRSTKAVRLKRIKPGFYNPPGGRPVFVPGFEWLCLMLAGLSPRSGPAQVAVMQWWTKRGEYATDLRTLQTKVLSWCAQQWRRRVLHVFDRGYSGDYWLSTLLYFGVRFVVRWPNRYHLLIAESFAEGQELPAFRIATGKKAWDEKQLFDTHTKDRRTIKILAFSVRHPKHYRLLNRNQDKPLWLVVARSGAGREPWYLLTNEPAETKEDAWRIYFAYHRRWQVELSFRFNKCELGMESPRLWRFENRLKLLAMVTLVYAFLMSLMTQAAQKIVQTLLRDFCHRTGKRGREVSTPLYRLRAALSRLWLAFPRHPSPSIQLSVQNPG